MKDDREYKGSEGLSQVKVRLGEDIGSQEGDEDDDPANSQTRSTL
jgi:hypothetical protein